MRRSDNNQIWNNSRVGYYCTNSEYKKYAFSTSSQSQCNSQWWGNLYAACSDPFYGGGSWRSGKDPYGATSCSSGSLYKLGWNN